ncbi:MAG: hypothetical protein ACRC0V_11570 [Fusobacteriaceae bacterium]
MLPRLMEQMNSGTIDETLRKCIEYTKTFFDKKVGLEGMNDDELKSFFYTKLLTLQEQLFEDNNPVSQSITTSKISGLKTLMECSFKLRGIIPKEASMKLSLEERRTITGEYNAHLAAERLLLETGKIKLDIKKSE